MTGTSKNRKTAARTTKGKAGKQRKTASKKKTADQTGLIRTEVLMISSFAIAVLLFLSNFHLCGVVGDFLRTMQLGTFGFVGFVFPILLFAGTCFYLSNRGNLFAMLKLAAMVIAIFALCALLQMIFGDRKNSGETLMEFYRFSSLHGAGGGLIGGSIAKIIQSVVGTIGAYLVLIVVLLICAVCITEKSVVSVVKRGSGKAYQYAKEDMDRRKELYAEKQEERKREREDKRVRGVNLNSTNLDPVQPDPAKPDPGRIDDIPTYQSESLDALSESLETADLFTGSILLPEIYVDEDTVPFDIADQVVVSQEGSSAPKEMAESRDEFHIPEESKRVVTTSGKVIESDTEALLKKLETKRAEVISEGEFPVSRVIEQKKEDIKKEYVFPPLTLLKKGIRTAGSFSDKEYKAIAVKLQQTLQNFGVGVTVTNISCGPSVTRYELHPEQGVKVSRIVALADDIKLSLAAEDIRIEAPIPGKSAVGIEVPNKENNVVLLRDLLDSDNFLKHTSKLAFAVGKDIGGQVVVTDIAKMPHLLIAGATGSGKSVCINTLIMSVIFKSAPEDVKLIMIDPKVVELSVYNGIPHLLIPVVTDPKKASGALNWAVAEMTDRYKKFAEYNVRDLKGYNEKIQVIDSIEDESKPQKLPQIIIIIDELADLMMVAPGEVEEAICRLAQLARAAGIHLVIATQRPSVNVITGLIKANVPSRIAFSVSSGVDSRTIIDMNGAEKLLGKGDMLFYPAGFPKPQRVQGAFVSDSEVQKVVDFLGEQGMTAEYNLDVESRITAPSAAEPEEIQNNRDEYFVQAGKFIIEKDKASIGMLQRLYKVGFNRAARIMDQLAEAGVVGEEEGTKPRKVLMTLEAFEELIDNGL